MQVDHTVSRKRKLPGARWIVLPLCVVVAALAIGLVVRQQGAAKTAAAEQGPTVFSVSTAQVTEGPLTTSLTYAADVKAVNQVSVVPKGTGRIEKLAVEVGSQVKKGDTIAELDADSLQAQVSQAKANLAAAKAKYAGMQAGPRDEQVAQAKAALDSAQARLDTVKKGPTESAIQAAQGQVDTARANLQKAKAAQETVKIGPTQAELAAAQAAVDASKVAILAAQANLDDLKAGPKDADLWNAQKNVDAARSALAAANDRVATWKGSGTDAEKGAQTGLPGVSTAVEAAQAAKTAYDAAVAALNQLKAGPTAAQLQNAETALRTAKTQYDGASAKLEQLQRGATPQDLQQADANVKAAESALATAEAGLKQLQDGPTAEDIRVAEAAVAQAEQAYELAQKPYTQNDLAQAAAAVQQAQSAVELAEIGLREAVVRSPVDGIVAEKLQSEGALVGSSTPIVTLVSGDVELALSVEESKVGQLKEGQKAEINATAYPGEALAATVASISPTADAKSRTFQVKVRPTDQGGKLRPGMFAQVKIATSEKPKALLVPKEALVTRGGQTVVFVVKGDTVQQRTVTTGITQGGLAEITNGLSAGEEVVTAGQNDLKDGSQVKKG